MPYNIGSRGSCMLGGNLATNCGGTRMVRHGSLRANTIGIEAVLANGTVIRDMSTMRKDNSGYDIKQLMIASEGTLGFITEAAVKCPVKAQSKHLVYLAVDSFDKSVHLLKKAREFFRGSLSAFELLDSCSQSVVYKASKKAGQGTSMATPF